MFLEKKEKGKLHTGSVLVGYDLGDVCSQISYCIYGQEDVETGQGSTTFLQCYVNVKGSISGSMARTRQRARTRKACFR